MKILFYITGNLRDVRGCKRSRRGGCGGDAGWGEDARRGGDATGCGGHAADWGGDAGCCEDDVGSFCSILTPKNKGTRRHSTSPRVILSTTRLEFLCARFLICFPSYFTHIHVSLFAIFYFAFLSFVFFLTLLFSFFLLYQAYFSISSFPLLFCSTTTTPTTTTTSSYSSSSPFPLFSLFRIGCQRKKKTFGSNGCVL